VSPLWRDEVAIYLAPRKLALVRRARGWRGRVTAAVERPILPAAAGDLGPALACLGDALSDSTWHRAVARVVVGPPWACHAIVPWPETSLDAAGRLAHARYVLGDLYGEAVASWAVTLADSPPGDPYVACAFPPALRADLEDALAPAQLALASLQPRLVVAFNTWRHRLPADDAWFVTVDDGSLSAVHLRAGAWDRLYTARLSQDWEVELERLQALARVMRAAGARPLFVDAPAWMRRAGASSAAVEWLGGELEGTETQELALLRRMDA
jgi:hypothetical protein